mmetsp:Transcript_4448/g.10414  ORF Transcript_4448/g.10414 Transcript_4448/m.10414 type:complete len:106 (+) Transcript_4448:71-388(+)
MVAYDGLVLVLLMATLPSIHQADDSNACGDEEQCVRKLECPVFENLTGSCFVEAERHALELEMLIGMWVNPCEVSECFVMSYEDAGCGRSHLRTSPMAMICFFPE